MKAAKLVRAVAVGAAFVGVAAAAWGCGGSATAGGGGTTAAAHSTAAAAETEHDAPPAPPAAPKIRYVAVVETEIDAQSGASAELNPAEVRQITAALRREAVENLPRGTYNIMTSETVQSMGGAVLEECADENCVITLGSRIGADYIVRGVISRFENKFTISVEMYETDNGMLVASSEYVRADSKAELMDKAVAASANMYRKFVNPAGEAVAPRQVNKEAAPTYPQSGVDGSGTLIDNRDGKTYKTVVIGGKRWMAENINYQPKWGRSWCYENNYSNCGKYGMLYDWETAKTVCPSGWHLPSRSEWNDLVKAAGGYKAGKKLKAKSGWMNGNGTDDYGFEALPSGYRYPFIPFGTIISSFGGGRLQQSALWWAAAENNSGKAYYRGVYYEYDYVDESSRYTGGLYKSSGRSVRCVAD